MNRLERNVLEAGRLRREVGPVTDLSADFVKSVSKHPILSKQVGSDANNIRRNFFRWHALARWADQGFNVFDLTHSLTAGLMLTQTKEDWSKDVKFPFSVMLIRLQDGFLSLNKCWVNYIWVHITQGDYDPVLSWSLESRGDKDNSFLLAGQCNVSMLNEALAGNIENEGDSVGDQPKHIFKQAMCLVSNFCCWLSAQPPGSVTSDSSSKKQRKGNEPWPTTWFVGRDVKLPSGFIKAAQDVSTGNTSKGVPGWKLRLQHIVRGHWRNQACGFDMSDRKRIWIEPYWKGPESAAAWAHLYQANGGCC